MGRVLKKYVLFSGDPISFPRLLICVFLVFSEDSSYSQGEEGKRYKRSDPCVSVSTFGFIPSMQHDMIENKEVM